ncbi:hypothetical protein D081_1522 [Anaerovibrio sp. JC8]|uniref:hypothetical protein n=1 Tax=Anaerovibrio sp. JC8 TaxID=1240085 RepID=UPI000A0ECCCE|nr:hypothetical protein [Anaerovibrio sp. JC8]ORT99941.1 hypothetical protein D081_1522 [Anaerovibrio sp. JC8]
MKTIKTISFVICLVLLLLFVGGCETKSDIEARQQQEREYFIKSAEESYQEGMAIFQEMDFSNPDKEKSKKASLCFFVGTADHRHFSEREDCASEVKSKCPNAEELYYTANCLEIISEWGTIEKGLTIKNSMLRYYAELIPEKYDGDLKEKVLLIRNQIIDIDENVVKPKAAALKERHKQLQAEYDRTYSERVAKQGDDDPYYDEEFYTAGNYSEDYDDDSYRSEKREDREHHRQSGGGTRRWR